MGSLPRVESNIVSCSSSYLYQYVGEGNHSHGVHDDPWSIHVVSFSEPGTYAPPGLSASLAESGFIVSESKDISEVHGPKSIVLVTDELSHSVLRYANYRIWETLKTLLGSGIPVLWVTKGAQLGVTNPDGALVQRLFRVVRREDLTARLTTLDMSSDYSGDGFAWWPRVVQILSEIRRGAPEAEYAERWGVLHVPRVIPDTPLSVFKRAEDDGVPSIRGALFSTPNRVQLMAERVGTLDMAWHETDTGELPELDGQWIEVEVVAIGINFKVRSLSPGMCIQLGIQ